MDIDKIRSEFPILARKLYNRPLVYLDNTATSQTPDIVVNEIVRDYTTTKANVHRGVHTLSQEATDLQETARVRIKEWINARSKLYSPEAPPSHSTLWHPHSAA